METVAVTLDSVGGPVQVETLDLSEPLDGEVLVKMGAAGICHSDQHAITGQHGAKLPCVLGHEGAGEVVAVGPNVKAIRVGDRVALNWVPSCGTCFYCARQQQHLCSDSTERIWSGLLADGTSRISRNGDPILHYCGISTWSEHMVVAEVSCRRIPDAVPYEVAALIGCGVATGVGAAIHRGKISEGDTVVVVGAGGVGLSAVMGARMAGAERIIAVDLAAEKKHLSTDLGATDFVAADDGAIDAVLSFTEGRGADVVIEAIGDTALQESWLRAVRPGGTMVLVGVPSTSDETRFISADLIRSEKTIKGSYYAATDTGKAIDDLCAAYIQKRLPIDRLISKRVAIEDIQEAIDAMLTGTEGRTVITFE
ncbi:MAG: alcohol dehydrogenase [Acidimicrobiaceae bacterium]|nr:alcohol dehydrogenase [Acidimicrobiaceae bacterium]|tara:strand:- start:17881 stop:18984 length:1104 start_codon:yes stop_codon:yes gene_type:complete